MDRDDVKPPHVTRYDHGDGSRGSVMRCRWRETARQLDRETTTPLDRHIHTQLDTYTIR